MADGSFDEIQDDVLKFMYEYLRKFPNHPWLVGHTIASDVNRRYGHDRTDVEEAVIRLGDVGKLVKRSETRTGQSYSIGSFKVPGNKVTTFRYRISDKGMQEIRPTKHTAANQSLRTDINAGNVVIVNGYNVGKITQTQISNSEDIEKFVEQLLNSDALTDETKKQIAIDSQLLRTELLSESPRKGVVQLAWATLSKAADIAGLLTAAAPIGVRIMKLL